MNTRTDSLLLVEEELPEDPHCVFRAVHRMADSPWVVVDLVIVTTLVCLSDKKQSTAMNTFCLYLERTLSPKK